MEKINRVFFHELGHFVARELNCRLYDSPHPAAIDIFPCAENRDEYCGAIAFDPAVTSRYGPVPKERLAGSIAATTYGCIFQAYFQHTSLTIAQDINGEEDIRHWVGALVAHSVNQRNIYEIEKRFFDYLVDNHSLDGFVAIEFNLFIEQTGKNTYTISIESLRKAIQPLLDTHYPDYQHFIDDLNQEIFGI